MASFSTTNPQAVARAKSTIAEGTKGLMMSPYMHEGPHIYDMATVLEYKAAELPPVQTTIAPLSYPGEIRRPERFKPLIEDFGPEHEKYTCLLCWKYACNECGYASNCWYSCPWCNETVSNTPPLSSLEANEPPQNLNFDSTDYNATNFKNAPN